MSQSEDLFEDMFGEVLEGGFEDKVSYLSMLFIAMVAEVDEVFDVVMGADVLHVLKKKSEEDFNSKLNLFKHFNLICLRHRGFFFSFEQVKNKQPPKIE